MERPRILVVEDEKDIRDLMALHLAREGFQPLLYESGEAAIKELDAASFDLAILDWMLPGVSGLELSETHRGRFPILMVTARAETFDIVRGLMAGADDYLVKPFEIPVFIARVHAMLRRKTYKTGAMRRVAVGDIMLDEDLFETRLRGEKIAFTPVEFRILATLMKNVGRVLTRKSLLDQIQGDDVTVTDRTIDVHIHAIRKKIGDAADMIETIRGIGYRIHAQERSNQEKT